MRQSRLDDGADASDASADRSGDEDEQQEREDENENGNDQEEVQAEFTRDIRSWYYSMTRRYCPSPAAALPDQRPAVPTAVSERHL